MITNYLKLKMKQSLLKRKKVIHSLFFYLIMISVANHSYSQSILPGEENDKNWNFVIAPYLWFGALNGQVGVANIEADINASFSDIFSNLNMAFMIYGEARYKKFGIAVDWLTLNMGLEGTRPFTGGAVKFDPKITFLETSLLYSFINNEKWNADVHVGIRSWWMKSTLEVERVIGNEPFMAEADVSWIDPIVGIKAVFLPHRKWPINAGFDIGGFGAGSEFTWNVQVGAGYRFAKSWTVLLQYRVLGVDYRVGESGSLSFRKSDANLFGPLVGIMATF